MGIPAEKGGGGGKGRKSSKAAARVPEVHCFFT